MAEPETPDAPPAEPAATQPAAPDPAPPAAAAAPDPAPEPDPLADPAVRAAMDQRLLAQQHAYEAKIAEATEAAKASAISELEEAARKEAELAAMSVQDRLTAQLAAEREGRASDAVDRNRKEQERKDVDARLEFLRALGTSDHQLVPDADFELLAYNRAKGMVGADGDYAKIIGDLAGAHPHLFRQAAAPASTSTSPGAGSPRGSTPPPTPPTPPPASGEKDAFDMTDSEWNRHVRNIDRRVH